VQSNAKIGGLKENEHRHFRLFPVRELSFAHRVWITESSNGNQQLGIRGQTLVCTGYGGLVP
jgi:hypothetical protein